jgi:hypothetical protein
LKEDVPGVENFAVLETKTMETIHANKARKGKKTVKHVLDRTDRLTRNVVKKVPLLAA